MLNNNAIPKEMDKMAKKKIKKNKKINVNPWQNYRVLILVLCFATVGVILLYRAFAETSYVSAGDQYTRIMKHRTEAHGLRPLPALLCLNMAAEDWSAAMASKDRAYHSRGDHNDVNFNDGQGGNSNANHRDWIGKYCDFAQGTSVSEIVGQGGSSESIFNAFLNSPGHHAIIDNNVSTHIGVGAYTDDNGIYYVTNLFCKGCTNKTVLPNPVDPNTPEVQL